MKQKASVRENVPALEECILLHIVITRDTYLYLPIYIYILNIDMYIYIYMYTHALRLKIYIFMYAKM
jgi:hypothetical protein